MRGDGGVYHFEGFCSMFHALYGWTHCLQKKSALINELSTICPQASLYYLMS